ncbi:MAG: hypothetical protein K0R73_642 [Candidatus Midichloriaceae bacterium]|jgi:hypothetical protein|nr:hypothetical protein [Candidatus Midichloriaceae bacterium]
MKKVSAILSGLAIALVSMSVNAADDMHAKKEEGAAGEMHKEMPAKKEEAKKEEMKK